MAYVADFAFNLVAEISLSRISPRHLGHCHVNSHELEPERCSFLLADGGGEIASLWVFRFRGWLLRAAAEAQVRDE